MNRRAFAKALFGGLIAAHEIDAERLLWMPGRKTIFIPAPHFGSIQEVAIYDHVPTDFQTVQRSLYAQMVLADKPVAFWRLDEPMGIIPQDSAHRTR